MRELQQIGSRLYAVRDVLAAGGESDQEQEDIISGYMEMVRSAIEPVLAGGQGWFLTVLHLEGVCKHTTPPKIKKNKPCTASPGHLWTQEILRAVRRARDVTSRSIYLFSPFVPTVCSGDAVTLSSAFPHNPIVQTGSPYFLLVHLS